MAVAPLGMAEMVASADDVPTRSTTPNQLEVAFDVNTLEALRSAVAGKARDLGATDVIIRRLQLVASELASNAVRHGGGNGRLRLWSNGTVLYCEVTDNGRGLADRSAGTTLPEPMRDEHRGLWIVRQLATNLAINPGPEGTGTVVTAAVPDDRHHAM